MRFIHYGNEKDLLGVLSQQNSNSGGVFIDVGLIGQLCRHCCPVY